MKVFDVDYALSILPALLNACLTTIAITLVAFAVALVMGLVVALLLQSRFIFIRWPVALLVQFIRSTPLLIQLYVLFFMLPDYGITLSPFATGVIGLGLHYSCYIAEVYRAGISAVAKGQWDAARALSYGEGAIFFRIILPQALRPIVPILANYMIAMFKDTPVTAAITVIELAQTANIIASERFLYVEPMTIVGAIFLALSLATSGGVALLQRRLAR